MQYLVDVVMEFYFILFVFVFVFFSWRTISFKSWPCVPKGSLQGTLLPAHVQPGCRPGGMLLSAKWSRESANPIPAMKGSGEGKEGMAARHLLRSGPLTQSCLFYPHSNL